MRQLIFSTLFMIILILGFFAYTYSSQSSFNPLKSLMDSIGYSWKVQDNNTKTQELHTTASADLMKVQQRMDEDTQEQKDFLNALEDQQQVLSQERQQAQDQLKINQQRQEEQMRYLQNR